MAVSNENVSQQQTEEDFSFQFNDAHTDFIVDKIMKKREDDLKDMQERFTLMMAEDISEEQQKDDILEYKMDFVNSLGKTIESLEKLESLKFEPECESEVLCDLLDTEKNMKELIKHVKTEIQEADGELARLDNHISSLKDLREKHKTQRDIRDAKDLEAMSRKALALYRAEKNDLAELVTRLYGKDEGMQNFLADLCNAYFMSDDPYIEANVNNEKYVQILLHEDIIERHPYDKKKVRLFKFLD